MSNNIRLITVIASLVIFSACTVGPNYVRPSAEVPASYKETAGWKEAQPKDETIRGTWWEVFNDPQLNALEEQVDISNQNVAVAEAQFRQARALVYAARAGYFPTITTCASFTRSRRPVSAGSSTIAGNTGGVGATGGSRGSTVTFSDYSLPVDFSWELDVWGRVRRTVEVLRRERQAPRQVPLTWRRSV